METHRQEQKQRGFLGNNTGTASTLLPQGFPSDEQSEAQKARAKRWRLKYTANQLLVKLAKDKAREIYETAGIEHDPSEPLRRLPRTCLCMHTIAGSHAQILRSKTRNRAHYGNLQRCGSVWRCPLCASKISEKRRQELIEANKVAKDKSLRVLLLTLTFPHGIGDDLTEILNKLHKAIRLFGSGRAAKDFRDRAGWRGTIRALEVTHGSNGWHPHFHILCYVDGSMEISEMESCMADLWVKACKTAKLPAPDRLHGCKLHDGQNAASYASKWGMENEMTKANLKQGKAGKDGVKGLSPWGLLEAAEGGDKRARMLWIEYAKAFHGRRQLFYSKGLKELLCVEDKTDEELAEEMKEPSDILAILTKEQWAPVIKLRKEAELLTLAEKNPSGIFAYVSSLADDYLIRLAAKPSKELGRKFPKTGFGAVSPKVFATSLDASRTS